MAVDLLFSQAPRTGQSVDLVFGDAEFAELPSAAAHFAIALAAPVVSVHIGSGYRVSVLFALPASSFEAHGRYDSNTTGTMAPGVETHYQQAARAGSVGVRASFGQSARYASPGIASAYQNAGKLRAGVQTSMQAAGRLRSGAESRFQQAKRARGEVVQSMQKAMATRLAYVTSFGIGGRSGAAVLQRFQKASRPQAGITSTPIAPGVDPCYIPSFDLLFEPDYFSSGTNLVFWCERHDTIPVQPITIPVRRAYIVINSIILTRVSNGLQLPALGLSMSLDMQSWTYGFSASLPASSFGDVEPTSGQPVELQASINGVPYRLLVEKINRERQFPSALITISGRGKNAVLDAPYSPAKTFGQTQDRTANQLMEDALTANSVPIGWDVDFGLTDWMVLDGAWNHQGTYISALDAIAKAAGGYLQPHPTADTLRVLSMYPTAPWEWDTVTPDYILPSSLVQRESIEWQDKPAYNRVYVSGQNVGVLGEVTRTGTAGDLAAPMVVDPLITHAIAARQRGISILADTGRQALVGLRLPVLPETGIIHPGKFVRYVDGGLERLGLVRSFGLETSPSDVWQTIGVQTYESV
jgi:hypothetical protein